MHPQQAAIDALALEQLHGAVPNTPEIKAVIDQTLDGCRGTEQFVDLVATFHRTDRGADLLAIALEQFQHDARRQSGASRLFRTGEQDLFKKPLAGDDATAQKALAVLGLVARTRRRSDLIEPMALDASALAGRAQSPPSRRSAAAAWANWRCWIWRARARCRSKFNTRSARRSVRRATAASGRRRPNISRCRMQPAAAHLPPLAELAKLRGNVEHGKVVFNTTGTCVKCHTVNHVGKEVGPNLSEIGNKATRDFLYESILFPSAAIAHNYETWRLELESGNVVTGIIVSETKDAISIKTADAIVQTYKPSDIESKTQLKVSLMPADLQKLMTTQDLTDVVEYLTTLKKAQ